MSPPSQQIPQQHLSITFPSLTPNPPNTHTPHPSFTQTINPYKYETRTPFKSHDPSPFSLTLTYQITSLQTLTLTLTSSGHMKTSISESKPSPSSPPSSQRPPTHAPQYLSPWTISSPMGFPPPVLMCGATQGVPLRWGTCCS